MKKLFKKIKKFFSKLFKSKSNTNPKIEKIPFEWRYGNFNGSKAKEDPNVVIANFTMNDKSMKIKWVKGMDAWGYERSDPKGVACIFYYDEVEKKYIGGKFEYISTSRSTRDWKNISGKYGGWNYTKFINAKKYAFLVTSEKGTKRTNIVEFSK